MGRRATGRAARDRAGPRPPIRGADWRPCAVDSRERNHARSRAKTERARSCHRRLRQEDRVEIDRRRQPAVRRNRRQEEACLPRGARREPVYSHPRHFPDGAYARFERWAGMRGVPDKPEARRDLRKAHRLAWISIAYILSTIAMLFM